MQKRHPGEGGAVLLGGERVTLTENHPIPQPTRRRFAVIVSPGFWRGYAVSVEPATITHQPRGFPDHGAAMAFAEELARLGGWPICDRAGGAE